MYVARLKPGDEIVHEAPESRHAWIHLAAGEITANGMRLTAGDGAAISAESRLTVSAGKPSDLVLFDLF